MRHNRTYACLSLAISVILSTIACDSTTLNPPAQVTQVVLPSTPITYPTLPPEWTATWTPEPTEVPPTSTATPAVIASETAQASPSPLSESAQPATACDHPWLPLQQGAQWTYRMQAGRMTWTVAEVSGDLAQAKATVVAKYPNATYTYHFLCDADGLKTYDFDYTVTDPSGALIIPRVLQSDGVWLPPASALDHVRIFMRWTESFSVSYDSSNSLTRAAVYLDEVDDISATVSVPAGKFNALDVNWDSRGATTRQGQANGDQQMNSNNMFFVRGTGIVLFNWPPEDANTAELVSYTHP